MLKMVSKNVCFDSIDTFTHLHSKWTSFVMFWTLRVMPDRRQSKMLLTIDERRTDENSIETVFLIDICCQSGHKI